MLHCPLSLCRDIAARNVLISRHGAAVLCDFGLSRAVPKSSAPAKDQDGEERVVEKVEDYETYYRIQEVCKATPCGHLLCTHRK